VNRFRFINQTITELNDNQIRAYAPAAFAESPTLEASAKYKFIETLVLKN
jgi:outer membrane scaffolding protein for murein synthesis (MipA/OmpV family)